MPRTDIVYPVTNFPIGELYFNTLLATLNLRSFVRATGSNGLSQLSQFRVTGASDIHFTRPSEDASRHTDGTVSDYCIECRFFIA